MLGHKSLVRGHIGYGVHKLIPQNVQYVTFLRQPIERLKSYIYHMRSEANAHADKGGWWYEAARSRMPLAEYAEAHSDKLIDNDQVRRLSGIDFSFGCCELSILERAKEHLRNQFAVFGITERFDDSVALMSTTLGWKTTPIYFRAKVKRAGLAREPLSNDDLRAIQEFTQYDQLLYEFAVRLFSSRIAEMSKIQRAVFRMTNVFVQPGLRAAYTIRKLRRL